VFYVCVFFHLYSLESFLEALPGWTSGGGGLAHSEESVVSDVRPVAGVNRSGRQRRKASGPGPDDHSESSTVTYEGESSESDDRGDLETITTIGSSDISDITKETEQESVGARMDPETMKMMFEQLAKVQMLADERRERQRREEDDRKEKMRQESEDRKEKERQESEDRKEKEKKERRELEDRREKERRDYEEKREERERRWELEKIEEAKKQRDAAEKRKGKLKGLGSYKDGCDLSIYLKKFETTLELCDINKREWVDRLYDKLPEKLCVRMSKLMMEGAAYEEVKGVLLDFVGETSANFGLQLFSLSGEQLKGLGAEEILDKIDRIFHGLFQSCKTVEECLYPFSRAVLRNCLPVSGKEFLEGRDIANWEGLRSALKDWLILRSKGNFFIPMGRDSNMDKPYRPFYWEGEARGTFACFTCGKPGHKAADCCNKSQGSGNGDATKTQYEPSNANKGFKCYACGEEGHRSFNCPKKGNKPVNKDIKTAHVGSLLNTNKKRNLVKGLVNGIPTDILVDFGADIGLVPKSLVPESQLVGEQCRVTGVTQTERLYELADVPFQIHGKTLIKRVIVDHVERSPAPWCLIPLDLNDLSEVKVFLEAVHDDSKLVKENETISVSVLTRAMSKKGVFDDMDAVYENIISNSDVQDGELAEDRTVDVPTEIAEESGLGEDVVAPEDEAVDSSGAGEVVEEESSDEPSVSSVVGRATELAHCVRNEGLVPVEGKDMLDVVESLDPVGKGSDAELFGKEVREDQSLKAWCELGDRKERGFKWKGDLLVQSKYVCWDEFKEVLVVPKGRRALIVSIAHDRGGSYGRGEDS